MKLTVTSQNKSKISNSRYLATNELQKDFAGLTKEKGTEDGDFETVFTMQ